MVRIVTLSLSTSKGVFHEKKVIPFFNLFVKFVYLLHENRRLYRDFFHPPFYSQCFVLKGFTSDLITEGLLYRISKK